MARIKQARAGLGPLSWQTKVDRVERAGDLLHEGRCCMFDDCLSEASVVVSVTDRSKRTAELGLCEAHGHDPARLLASGCKLLDVRPLSPGEMIAGPLESADDPTARRLARDAASRPRSRRRGRTSG